MRGRKPFPITAIYRNGIVPIKKESPNEGTETKIKHNLNNSEQYSIKKESPNEGTETLDE